MKLIIPDNNDPNLLDMVSRLMKRRSQYIIREVYGKPTINNYLGSGRTNLFFDDLSRNETIRRITGFKELGIDYNYAINGLLPRSRILSNRVNVVEELKWIESSSIKTITVANYELARLAATYCPDVAITVSFFAGINSEERLVQWSGLPNVTTVIVDRSTYRNIALLGKLVKTGRKYDVGIRVIANLGCMSDCIRTEEHALIKDLASVNASGLHYAPCTFYCMKRLLENPEEFLQLPIIRPEDLSIYEKIGIEGVKLVDRVQTTPWIERVVGYYLDGSFDGNILDLTCNFTTFNLEGKTNAQVEEIDIAEIIKSREGVLKYREILPELIQVSIDPSFNFLACDNTCDICEVCNNTSAIKYDQKRRVEVLKQLTQLETEYLFK